MKRFFFPCPQPQIKDLEPLDMQTIKLRLFIALEPRHESCHEFHPVAEELYLIVDKA